MPNAAASRLILEPFSEQAVTTASREALQEIGGHVTCALVFCSADYRADLADFVELIQLHAHAPLVVGCSASGLLGTEHEAEGARGFSLLLLHLPETRVQVISFDAARLESLASPAAWHEFTGSPASEPGGWIVLADPFSLPVEQWLERWNAAYPNLPSLGGLASGGRTGDDVFVFRDGHLQEGAVALGLFGGVRLHPVISQGCRPIGEPFTITGADDNLVTSLGSRPAFERLVETVNALPAQEQMIAARGNLFAGLAMSEYIEEFKTGDFLIRNLFGADEATGALALGAHPRIGQTLQFQLRDRTSATEELHRLLADRKQEGITPFASLVFSCTGRGKGLFGRSYHDAGAIAEHFGPRPSAGFFGNGEIGPVGGRTFIHGYTASIALLANA